MFATKVIHVIGLDANLVSIANRFLDLMEVDLVKLPALANDLKNSMDQLETAVKNQTTNKGE